MNNDQLPEAPASVTIKYKSARGFEHLFTLRAKTGRELIEKMELVEAELVEKGAAPVTYASGKFPPRQVEYVPGRICPNDGAKLIYAKKQDGTKFIKCENNKWDAIQKKTIGCAFVEWPKSNNDDSTASYSDY